MNNDIKKILVTEEALESIQDLVNNSKEQGLVDVKCEFDQDQGKMNFEMVYKSVEHGGEVYTRSLSINLENPWRLNNFSAIMV